MATASLITQFASLGRESNYSLNVNPLLKTRTQVHYQTIRKNKSFLIKRPEYQNNRFRVQCCMKPNNGFEEEKEKERKGNALDEIIEVIFKTLSLFIQKSAIAGVILGLLMTCNPHLALAASGGRMGGRSFSSSSSSGSSSSSSSSSGSSSSSSRRSSYSSSSPSYSSRRRSSYYSSPSPSYYSSGYYSKRKLKTASETEDEAFSILLTLFIFGAIFWYVTLPGSDEKRQPTTSRQSSASDDQRQPKQSRQSSVDTNKATVIMLQVALLGATRSLQKDLDEIAEVADTSTTSGLSYILQESTVALLRHLAFCFSSFSSVDIKPDKTEGENLFNQLTIEERAKFDEETLVNVDNIKKKITPRKNPNGLSSDYIVMTILVATKGECKLCVVNNSQDLKQALQKLGSIPTSKILAVEVMWTPQEENDTLSERDLLKDYPRLKPF